MVQNFPMLVRVWSRLPPLCFLSLAVGGALGCGGDPSRPAATDLTGQQPQGRAEGVIPSELGVSSAADARNVVATGACADSSTIECRVYLPSYNGVQPCYVGEQHCTEATWGPCQGARLVDANRQDAPLTPSP